MGVLGRALVVEADAIWGAVVAEEGGRCGGRRGVVGVGAQRGEERRLGLPRVLADHGHGEGGEGGEGGAGAGRGRRGGVRVEVVVKVVVEVLVAVLVAVVRGVRW